MARVMVDTALDTGCSVWALYLVMPV